VGSARAWASASVRVCTAPVSWRTALELVVPRVTKMRLVPRLLNWATTAAWAPWPIDMRVMSASTSMIMPNMDRPLRSLLANSDAKAIRRA
jgi:hypothetical protein